MSSIFSFTYTFSYTFFLNIQGCKWVRRLRKFSGVVKLESGQFRGRFWCC